MTSKISYFLGDYVFNSHFPEKLVHSCDHSVLKACVTISLKSASFMSADDNSLKYDKNTNSKSGSAYQVVELRPVGCATFCRFPLPLWFQHLKSVNKSKTVRFKLSIIMFTEHGLQTGVDLSMVK